MRRLHVNTVNYGRVSNFEIAILCKLLMLQLKVDRNKRAGNSSERSHLHFVYLWVVQNVYWYIGQVCFLAWYFCRLTCESELILSKLFCELLFRELSILLCSYNRCHALSRSFVIIGSFTSYITKMLMHRRSVNFMHHLFYLIIIISTNLHIVDIVFWLGKLQATLVKAHIFTILEKFFYSDLIRILISLWIQ